MIFRAARHTDNLKPIEDFYTSVIGLSILGRFEDHAGYDGIFLGIEGENWHLEFTAAGKADHKFDEDDLLVFYPQTLSEYDAILSRIKRLGIQIHQSKNPYWNENGILVRDPDGFGVIVSALRVKG